MKAQIKKSSKNIPGVLLGRRFNPVKFVSICRAPCEKKVILLLQWQEACQTQERRIDGTESTRPATAGKCDFLSQALVYITLSGPAGSPCR
jgi:hypothetical protein